MQTDSAQGTVEIPVPIYIDRVALGRAQGAGLYLIEPERIEILRGPQGQLFGHKNINLSACTATISAGFLNRIR